MDNPLPEWDRTAAITRARRRLLDAGYKLGARGWEQPKRAMTSEEAQDILFLRHECGMGGVVA